VVGKITRNRSGGTTPHVVRGGTVSKKNRSQRRPTSLPRKLSLERLECREVPSASFGDLAINSKHFDQHQIIVALRNDASSTSAAALHIRQTAVSLGDGLYRVSLPNGIHVAQGLAYYGSQVYVRYAQPDYTVSLAKTPNDPSFSQQWGLNNTGQNSGSADADIDAPEAWNISTGSGKTIVAVIDTGVDYTHPDLAANIWTNTREIAGNGIDDDRNGYVDDVHGWDFANNDNNPMDDNGHGTHVAGIIGAVGNNGIGIDGVNWRVQIMALKFLDASGSGSLSNAIRALNYAVANGAVVTNNSYSGGYYYQAFNDAIKNAQSHGVIFVAAAGNGGTNTDTSPAYPSGYNPDNVISVAATDRNDGLASFSNYGPNTVDLAAPGVQIYSTLKGNSYGSMSGTSMAAPFVTGAVALLRDVHPTWTYQQIINQLYSTVDPLSSLRGKVKTGGRLNIGKALGGSSNGGTGGGGGSGGVGSTTPSNYYSPDPPRILADSGTTTSTLTIGSSSTIGRISVKVNITHPSVGDLRITLKSPTGATIQLFNRRGGSGDNINAVFDDRSSTPVAQAAAPFLGWNKPEQALALLNGKSAQGTWTLIVEDLATGNVGKLNSWALIVEPAAGVAAAATTSIRSNVILGGTLDGLQTKAVAVRLPAPTRRTPKKVAPPSEPAFNFVGPQPPPEQAPPII
jgi:subtilisin family serine protease